jgi:hypothetical protein
MEFPIKYPRVTTDGLIYTEENISMAMAERKIFTVLEIII